MTPQGQHPPRAIVVRAGDSRLFELHWILTRRCTYACSYCPPHRHDVRAPQLETETILRSLDRITALLSEQSVRINLTGGEPTVHPAFVPFVASALMRPMVRAVRVVTNLSTTDHLYADAADAARATPRRLQVVASFHPAQAVRDPFVRRVALLLEGGVDVSVKLMAGATGDDRLVDLIDALSPYAVSYPNLVVWVQRIRGSAGLAGLDLSRWEERYQSRVIEWGDAREVVYEDALRGNRREVVDPDLMISRGENRFMGWSCDAGVRSLFIEDDGSAYAALCKPGPALFNVVTSATLTLGSGPVKCPHGACGCGATIRIPKRQLPS